MFRIEPSTTVQRGAYDVCNKEAVRQINDCYFKLYSDHTAGACNCRGNGLGNPARRWGSDVARGKYALQYLSSASIASIQDRRGAPSPTRMCWPPNMELMSLSWLPRSVLSATCSGIRWA